MQDNKTIHIKLGENTFAFLVIFGICIYICSFVGFPIVLPDSRRYLGSAALMETSYNAPTLFSFLLRPFYLWLGPWTFFLINCLFSSVLSICTSRSLYNNIYLIAATISLVISLMIVNMTFVMMDIYVIYGVLSLLLLSIDRGTPLVKLILALCFISHNSALLIIMVVGLSLCLATKNVKFIKSFLIIICTSILCLCAYNYKFENRLNPLPKHASQFLVARLMVDIPESMDSYISANPNSVFAPHWGAFREKFRDQLSAHNDIALEPIILWSEDGILNLVGKDNVAKEYIKFVSYTITHYPGQYLSSLARNLYRFFSNFSPSTYTIQAFSGWSSYDYHEYASQYFPKFSDDIQDSAQQLDRIHVLYSPHFTAIIFIISMIFNIFVVILHKMFALFNKKIYIMAFTAIVFFIVNAFVSANFGVNTSDGRFFIKPFWPSILSLALFVENFLRTNTSNFLAKIISNFNKVTN